jgi:hypothetical protein
MGTSNELRETRNEVERDMAVDSKNRENGWIAKDVKTRHRQRGQTLEHNGGIV